MYQEIFLIVNVTSFYFHNTNVGCLLDHHIWPEYDISAGSAVVGESALVETKETKD